MREAPFGYDYLKTKLLFLKNNSAQARETEQVPIQPRVPSD